MFRVFVGGEAGAVGGYLEQHPARLTELDGLELVTVDHRCHSKACLRQPFPPRGMLLLVGRPEGDVMDPSGSYETMDREVWALHEAHAGTRAPQSNLKGGHLLTTLFVLLRLAEPHHVRDDPRCRGEVLES